MIKPDDVELFTAEEEEKITKIISHMDEALKKSRGDTCVHVRIKDRVVFEVAKRYADAGWMTTLYTDNEYFYLIRVVHPRTRPAENVFSGDTRYSGFDQESSMRFSESGDLVPNDRKAAQ